MNLNDSIIYMMVGFMLLGALDVCIGGRLGFSGGFEEGIKTMGQLALSMVGIICIAPVLGGVLTPVVAPLYRLLGADPAMFAGTLLANDMGGYALAQQMTADPMAAELSGLVLGSMLGANIVFSIPVSLAIIEKKDIPAFATGTLYGMIAIPVGCLTAGMVAGYPVLDVLRNLVPVILTSALVAFGLWRAPRAMVRGFWVLGRCITVIATAAFALAILEKLTGISVISGMAPVDDALVVVGDIAVVLAGAFTMVTFITKVFRQPLMRLGYLLGINETAAAGLIATLANNVAMFRIIKDMDERGKVVNVAFAVCISALIGDHLGFTAAVAPHMIAPVLSGKLVAGLCGAAIALIFQSRRDRRETGGNAQAHLVLASGGTQAPREFHQAP